jgi:mannose-6-phosphate isomerase-like protein (cupin superfamily)
VALVVVIPADTGTTISIARMSPRILHATEAFWRPSNQMGVLNTDLAKQLDAESIGARLWRLARGQASTKHRHGTQTELYVVLEGTGRMRVGDQLFTLDPLSSALVEPSEVRQIFNDGDVDALWLVVGTPSELGNTLEMTPEQLAALYPDGPRALPPELS